MTQSISEVWNTRRKESGMHNVTPIDRLHVNNFRPQRSADCVVGFEQNQNGPGQKKKTFPQVGNNKSRFCSHQIERKIIVMYLSNKFDGGILRL